MARPQRPLAGVCEPGFERVRDALTEILAAGSEVGAALAVYVDRRAVVDLWGGYTDAARTRPWDRDTIVNLYSVGKAVTAVCALRLVEAGLLDLDAPVADYWPEFALAETRMNATRHGTVPRLLQAWFVPRCTSTSPARRRVSPSSIRAQISPLRTIA